MRNIWGIVVGLCFLAIGAANVCAAPKKQTAPAVQPNATLYFLRPSPVLPISVSTDVTVDGKSLGSLGTGGYLTVNVPLGIHTISVQGGLFSTAYESELEAKAGQSYYVEIGPRADDSPGMQLFTRVLANNTMGERMPGRGFLAAYTFYLLGADEGRAKIATLKRVTQ